MLSTYKSKLEEPNVIIYMEFRSSVCWSAAFSPIPFWYNFERSWGRQICCLFCQDWHCKRLLVTVSSRFNCLWSWSCISWSCGQYYSVITSAWLSKMVSGTAVANMPYLLATALAYIRFLRCSLLMRWCLLRVQWLPCSKAHTFRLNRICFSSNPGGRYLHLLRRGLYISAAHFSISNDIGSVPAKRSGSIQLSIFSRHGTAAVRTSLRYEWITVKWFCWFTSPSSPPSVLMKPWKSLLLFPLCLLLERDTKVSLEGTDFLLRPAFLPF